MRRIGTLLKANWLLLVATVVVCEALALAWTVKSTPIYRAHTSMEIEAVNQDFLNLRTTDPTTAISGVGTAYIQTQSDILQSETLVGRVVDRLHLDTNPQYREHQGKVSQLWVLLGAQRPAPVQPRERAIAAARSALRVRPPRDSNVLEVLYDSPDRDGAADFLNTLTDEYMSQTLESRWHSAQQTSELLRRQLEGVKTKLEASEHQLQERSRAMGILVTDDKNSVAEARLRQIQEELSRAQGDRMTKQSQYEMAVSMQPNSLPAVLDNGPLREYQLKVSDLRREEAEQSVLLAPTSYKIQRLRAQIEEVSAAMAEERNNVVGRVRNEYEAAKVREDLLSGSYTQQLASVDNLGAQMAQYSALKHTVDSNRVLYEGMMVKMNDAALASAIRSSNVRVVDPATPPSAPSEPNVPLNLGLALGTGLILGNIMLLIGESTNSLIKKPGHVTHLLHVPQLGTVPSTKFIDGDAAILPGPSDAPLLIADSFRSIVTSILLSSGVTPQVIAVTSPGAGDGKTTVTLNLARALSSIGQKVLLIEGDPRSQRLQKILGFEDHEGLGEILCDERAMDELPLGNYAHETDIPRVSLLTSGISNGSLDVPVLRYSKRMLQLLEFFKRKFDTVLIDTPPLLLAPEARICGRLAGGVVLVLRAGRTTQELAVACHQRLIEDGSVIVGTVLNDVRVDMSNYAYYGTGRKRRLQIT